jgi:hypothetical protein
VSFVHCLLVPELWQRIIESVLKLYFQVKAIFQYFKCKKNNLKHTSPRVFPTVKCQWVHCTGQNNTSYIHFAYCKCPLLKVKPLHLQLVWCCGHFKSFIANNQC